MNGCVASGPQWERRHRSDPAQVSATGPWTLQRACQPAGVTLTASRVPHVRQKCGGSYSHRQPAHSATGRPHPSQNAATSSVTATLPVR
jgi:hypothetical protein